MVNQRVGNLRRERTERSKLVYRPPSPEFIKRQSERRVSRFDSIFKDTFTAWRPKEGENVIRILQASWDRHNDYAYTIFFHRNVGPDNSNYLCLRKMLDKACPICNEAAAARKAGEADEARNLNWSEGKVVWLIDRAEERGEPMIYQLPITVYTNLCTLAYDGRTGRALFIDDPDSGYDVLLRRNGTGLQTRYLPQIDRDPSPVAASQKGRDKIEEFLKANPIPDCLEFKSFGYLERLLSGSSEKADPDLEDEDTTDEDEPRARVDGKERKKFKTRSRDDEDEDRPRKKKAVAVEEDEDGDEAVDEDEEEARPRRKAMTRDVDEEEQEEREARNSRDEDDEDEPRAKKKPVAKAKKKAAPPPEDDEDEDLPEEDTDDEDQQEEDDDDPSEDRRSARSRMPSGESRRVGSGRRQFRD